jgi:peptidoglycan hydrolase CwlO-like protein
LENYERETQLLRSSAHSLNTKLRFFEERSAELETMAKQSGSQLSAQRSLTRNLEQSLEQYAGSQLSLLAQKNGEAAAWQAEAAKKALEAAAYRGQRNVYLVLLIALGIGIIAGGIFVFLQKLRK